MVLPVIKTKLSPLFSCSPSPASVHCLLFQRRDTSSPSLLCWTSVHSLLIAGGEEDPSICTSPSSPLCLLPYIPYSLFFYPHSLLTIWTFIPSHLCTIPHANLWLFPPISPFIHHLIDQVYTCIPHCSALLLRSFFIFLSVCFLSSFIYFFRSLFLPPILFISLHLFLCLLHSLPAGCFRAVCHLMFLWEVIKAWITDCMCAYSRCGCVCVSVCTNGLIS